MWVKLDDEFYDHPKWAGAPGDSIALWVAMIAWCNRNDSTEGYIPALKTHGLVNVRNVKATLADLCSRGTPPVIRRQGDGYVIHDYAEYQQPERVREIAAKRAEAGKRGAAKRWQGKANDMANAIASATASGKANGCPDPVPDPYLQSETSSRPLTADDEMAKRIEGVAHSIIDWRTRDDPPRDRAAYHRAAIPNVVAQHGERITELMTKFPLAPVDSIVHAVETGDTRNLVMFTDDTPPALPENVHELPARKLNGDERLAAMRSAGAPTRLTGKHTEGPL